MLIPKQEKGIMRVSMNPLLEKKYLEEQMKDDTVSTFYLIFIPGQTS